MLPNFQVPSIFLGLFIRKFEVEDFKQFSETLPWRLPELDAEPALNRVPADAPADVPRVRFGSKDGRLFLELAPAKLHLRVMPGQVNQTPQGTNVQALPVRGAYEAFLPVATRIHTTLAEHFGLTAMRAGVVTDFIAPVPSSANQRLQKTLLATPNIFGDRLQDLQIQTLNRISIGETQANRRINLRTMRTGQEGNPDLIINTNVDINTLAEEPYDMTTADLERFLKGVAEHLDTQVPFFDEKALFQ